MVTLVKKYSGDLGLKSHFCQNYFGPIHLVRQTNFEKKLEYTVIIA